jgi:hypothetical protein
LTGSIRPKAKDIAQFSLSSSVWATRVTIIRSKLTSSLQESPKTMNIHRSSGVIGVIRLR